jgi:hypothetical protein
MSPPSSRKKQAWGRQQVKPSLPLPHLILVKEMLSHSEIIQNYGFLQFSTTKKFDTVALNQYYCANLTEDRQIGVNKKMSQ